MPVTAKFSEEFYQKLGHDVADELVDWFNTVDATYRSDFRHLFDGRFATLDARLEQRFTTLEAKFDQSTAALEARFNERFTTLEAKLEQRIVLLGSELRREIAGYDARIRVDMHGMESRLTRWIFVTWAGTIGTLIALLRLWG